MVSRFVWIIGVGTPIVLMIYFGLAGLYLIPYQEQTFFTYRPSVDISWLFLVFGAIGLFSLASHYYLGKVMNAKHCEFTQMILFASFTVMVILFVKFVLLKEQAPFALASDWFWLIGLTTLASLVGVILYRIEKGKLLIPIK